MYSPLSAHRGDIETSFNTPLVRWNQKNTSFKLPAVVSDYPGGTLKLGSTNVDTSLKPKKIILTSPPPRLGIWPTHQIWLLPTF